MKATKIQPTYFTTHPARDVCPECRAEWKRGCEARCAMCQFVVDKDGRRGRAERMAPDPEDARGWTMGRKRGPRRKGPEVAT